MYIGRGSYVCVGGLDSGTEVHRDDLTSAVSRRVVRVTADPATCVQDHLLFEEGWFDRINPVQELRLVQLVHLDELLPLPSECGGRALLDRGQVRRHHAGDAPHDRKHCCAPLAYQLARRDFAGFHRIHQGGAQLHLAAA